MQVDLFISKEKGAVQVETAFYTIHIITKLNVVIRNSSFRKGIVVMNR